MYLQEYYVHVFANMMFLCRVQDGESELYENIQKISFKGAIESLAFSKVFYIR